MCHLRQYSLKGGSRDFTNFMDLVNFMNFACLIKFLRQYQSTFNVIFKETGKPNMLNTVYA